MWRSIGRDFTRRPIGLASLLVLAGRTHLRGAGRRSAGHSASAAKNSRRSADTSQPETAADTSIKIEIYGFTQGDMINDFKTNNPDWFDVNRPSRLPAFEDEFGAQRAHLAQRASVALRHEGAPSRRARSRSPSCSIGISSASASTPARRRFGRATCTDSGGVFGAGQTESPFMDLDVFPNILEYWGPNGMLFFRNVQFFYEPLNEPNGTRAIIALERPGASGDAGVVADRVELQNILARFPVPDISATYRYAGNWGYVEDRRHPAVDPVGRRPHHRRVRPERRRHRLGGFAERSVQARQEGSDPHSIRLRRRRRELLQRRAGRRRRSHEPRRAAHAGHGQSAPRFRHGPVPRPYVERPLHERRSATLASTSTTAICSCPRRSRSASTRRRISFGRP